MRTLANLAAQYVGRRVKLTCGAVGTITRVTARGFTVAVPNVTHDDIESWID